jgi:hypothetical protein
MTLIQKARNFGRKIERTKIKIQTSDLYGATRRAGQSAKVAIRKPYSEVKSPAARKFRRRSREMGEVLFGSRYR